MLLFDLQNIQREFVKALLRPFLRWKPLENPLPGFSIILGTPWALRHLLEVNLRFVEKTDLSRLHRLYVIFDRVRQTGADDFIETVKAAFPRLPLDFQFHPPVAGKIVRLASQSKFYASLNWITGLRACQAEYAILHDFDLYPVVPAFFADIVRTMEERNLRFSGSEYTHFDGLTDNDALIGTWELGVDVPWIRREFRPVQCFHKIARAEGRRIDLDAFSYIQMLTPERALAGTVDRNSYAHVTNLCSTYLRFSKGEQVTVAWRLHYLWYLESLSSSGRDLGHITRTMKNAESPLLSVDGRTTDFSQVHVTCANVLRDNLVKMETALSGGCRSEVMEYIEAYHLFLCKYGDARRLGTTCTCDEHN